MKKKILILGFILSSVMCFSQDIELFHRTMDDRLLMPMLPIDMSFDEFQILSRDVKLMDMAAAAALPGYISFKAKENTAAYISMAVRAVGYAGAFYELYRYDQVGGVELALNKTDNYIGYATIGVLAASYLFDWIYGKTMLAKKQEAIRYKYRKELENQGN